MQSRHKYAAKCVTELLSTRYGLFLEIFIVKERVKTPTFIKHENVCIINIVTARYHDPSKSKR
jgi:hypothetical protein